MMASFEDPEPGGISYCENRLNRDKSDFGRLFRPEPEPTGGSGAGREDVGTEYERGEMVGLIIEGVDIVVISPSEGGIRGGTSSSSFVKGQRTKGSTSG
jgi:hypothetical protein